MKVIVPLAGPDFVRADSSVVDGGVKATLSVDGEPLLRRALDRRPWSADVAPADYVFVLHENGPSRRFAHDVLRAWYPGSRTVFVSDHARGAALSAAAGVALAAGPTREPLAIDLADILYECDVDPIRHIGANARCGAVALTFRSDDPAYSYLRTDGEGRFVEAAEKRVIAPDASAGTYLFRDAATYMGALAHALADAERQTYRSLFYVCPLMNGVRAGGMDVILQPVGSVRDIKEPTS